MSEGKTIRINKVLKDLNISLATAVEELKKHKNIEIEESLNTKITEEAFEFLSNKFKADKNKRAVSKEIVEDKRKEREAIRMEQEKENQEKRKQQEQEVIRAKAQLAGLKPVGKIDLDGAKKEEKTVPAEAPKTEVASTPPTPVEPVVAKEVEVTPAAEVVKNNENKNHNHKDHKEIKKKESPKPNAQKNKTVYQNPLMQDITPPKKKEQQHTKHKEEPTPEIPIGVIETQYQKLTGPKVVGEKIDLSQFEKKKKKRKRNRHKDKEKEAQTTNSTIGATADSEKRKRKRIRKDEVNVTKGGDTAKKEKKNKIITKIEPTEEEVQKQVRETLERLQGKGTKSKGAKYRKEKRETHRQKAEQELAEQEQQEKILKVTEFVTVNELATMMDVPINKVIGACMSLGIMVTMNQRLDAETLTIVADEFG